MSRSACAALLLICALVPVAQAEIPVTDDTFTTTAAPTKTFGSSIALVIQSPTATGSMASPAELSGYTAYAYMRFDTAAFPSLTTANLKTATLRLFVNYVVSPGKFDVYLVGGPWSEATLTASTAGAAVQTGSAIASGINVTKGLQYLDIDITAAVLTWLTTPATNYGLILLPSAGSNIFASFDSKENPLTAHDPRVTVLLNDASQADLQNEINRAEHAEAMIANNLTGEINRAEAAEGTLTTNLNNEIGARQAGDNATALGAKNYTDAAIGAEITQRQLGDAQTLGSSKAYTDTSVAAANAALTSADTLLRNNITSVQNSLSNYAQLANPNIFLANQTFENNVALTPKTQATSSAGVASPALDLTASVADASNNPQAETFRWQTVPVNNGQSNFAGQLNLLYSGSGPFNPTGFSVNSDGSLNLVSNQILVGDGSEVKNVNAVHAVSADSATNATNATNAVSSTNAVNAVNATTANNALQLGGMAPSSFAQTGAGNNFMASQTINGNLTLNGNLILNGAASGIQFSNGTSQNGAGGASAAPPPPPPAYTGTFQLQIPTGPSTTETLPLVSFAGCDEKILGVEYDDCYFQINHFSPAVTQWLNDTVSNTGAPIRDVVVQAFNSVGTLVASLQIGQAFIRDFTISDSDGSSAAQGTLNFVLVPASLATGADPSGVTAPPTWNVSDFRFSAQNVDGSRVDSIRGVHMSVPKLPAAPAGFRHQFQPGTPIFDNISILFSAVGQTNTDFQTWANNVAEGNTDQRSGSIQYLNSTQTLATLQLNALSPVSLSGFSGLTGLARRTIVLTLGSFQFQ